MIANLTYSPAFYTLVPILYLIMSIWKLGLPNDLFDWSLRFLFAFLILIFSTLLESFLKTPVRHPYARKAWIVLLLVLTPYLPMQSYELKASIGLLCLMGFFWSVRRFFYQKQGYLLFVLCWAVPLGFLSPFLYPFLLAYLLPLFRKDRESTYIVFSALSIPILFAFTYQYQNTPGFLNQWVHDYLPFFSHGILLWPKLIIEQGFRSLTDSSFLLAVLYFLFSLKQESNSKQESNFRQALLIFLPFYCFFLGFHESTISAFPLFLVALYFIENQAKHFDLLELKQSGFQTHCYRLAIVIIVLFPFYERASQHLFQTHSIRPKINQHVFQ